MRPPSWALMLLAALCAGAACRRSPEAPPRGLLILTATPMATFDPHVPFDDVTSGLLGNVYEPLVDLDADVRLRPRLALSWVNPDDHTWRFSLDPAARFSDGSPLAAQDVKHSIERVRSLAGSGLSGTVRSIQAVSVLDALTLELRTDRPVAILNDLTLVPIVSARRAPLDAARGPEELLGTGPYRLAAWRPEGTATFEVNWHSPRRPIIASAELRLADDFARDARRLRPDLGLAFNYAAVEALQEQPEPGLRVVPAPGFFVVYLALNVRPQVAGLAGMNPLADRRVRQALALASDREAVARDGLRGLARPVGQMAVPQVFGYDPQLPVPRYDPQAARDLLRASGAPQLELQLSQAEAGSGRVERALIASWAQAGIRASVRRLGREQYRQASERGDYQAVVGGWSCSGGDAAELLTYLLHSAGGGPEYGAFNSTGWGHAELDAIAEGNLRILNPHARLPMLQRALRLAAEELAFVPLVARDDVYLVADALRFTPRPDGRIDLAGIERVAEAR